MTDQQMPHMQPRGVRRSTTQERMTQAEIQAKLRASTGTGRPQPMATRHHDPRFNPDADDLTPDGSPHIGPAVKRFRMLLRKGYVFFLGERDAYEGPQTMYLSEEEMKGQEHKFEPIGDAPVASVLSTAPAGLSPDMGREYRHKKMAQLKGELAALQAEEEFQEKKEAEAKAARDDARTRQEPLVNPEAERVPMTVKPDPKALHAPPSEAPPMEPTGRLNEGTVTGPPVNTNDAALEDLEPPPAKKKRGRGRPPGATSKVGRDVSQPNKVNLKS